MLAIGEPLQEIRFAQGPIDWSHPDRSESEALRLEDQGLFQCGQIQILHAVYL